MSTAAIRASLERAKEARRMRINHRDDIVSNRLLDAMQLSPGADTPSVEMLNHEDHGSNVGLLDDELRGAAMEGERFDGLS